MRLEKILPGSDDGVPMKKIIPAIFALLPTFCLAIEIASPHSPDFYTFPNWLPNEVTPAWTPGADSSFATETIYTTWTTSDSGNWQYSGTYALIGLLPTWDGAKWTSMTDLIDKNTAPYKPAQYPDYNVQLYGETQDFGFGKDATVLYSWVNNEVWDQPYGSILVGDYVAVNWTREKQIKPTPSLLARRFTEELQSSAFHTLDGWCEREYFSSLATPEPWHDLSQVKLLTLATNRNVTTRRIAGKTNLWAVAETILSTSRRGWDADYLGMLGYDSPISTWWSSQAFDNIYESKPNYGAVPEPTSGWMRVYDHTSKTDNVDAVYKHFEYKCPVLNGLQSSQPFENNNRQFGFLFGDLLFNSAFNSYRGRVWHDTSVYPQPDDYQKRQEFKHDFDFERVCQQDFESTIVSNIAVKTLRTELYSQGAINQAEYELNRSYCPMVLEGRNPTNVNYRKVMEWNFKKRTLEVYQYDDSYRPMYKLSEDYTTDYSDWQETTNYYETIASETSLYGGFNHIQLSKTTHGIRASVTIGAGSRSVDFTSLLHDVNAAQIDPNLSPLHVGVRQYAAFSEGWEIDFSVSAAGMWQPVWQHVTISALQTNAEINLTVHVDNAYDLRTYHMAYKDFTGLAHFPCNQGEGRMKSCRDIWMNQRTIAEVNTASHWPYYDLDYPDIDVKCDVNSRSNWMTEALDVWHQNQTSLWQALAQREGYQQTSPMSWIDFGKSDLKDVLESFKLTKGEFEITLPMTPELPVFTWNYDTQQWEAQNFTTAVIPLAIQPSSTYDTSKHQIVEHPFTEGIVDTTCITVVDWNWMSIKAQ